MIGLDTNVLVRHLVQDDPGQGATASRFIEGTCSEESPCFINRVVLCELVWVLETAYGYVRGVIADVIERLLRTIELEIEDAEAAWPALQAYRGQGVDFGVAFIGHTNREHGCGKTVTFDGRASRLDVFFLPD